MCIVKFFKASSLFKMFCHVHDVKGNVSVEPTGDGKWMSMFVCNFWELLTFCTWNASWLSKLLFHLTLHIYMFKGEEGNIHWTAAVFSTLPLWHQKHESVGWQGLFPALSVTLLLSWAVVRQKLIYFQPSEMYRQYHCPQSCWVTSDSLLLRSSYLSTNWNVLKINKMWLEKLTFCHCEFLHTRLWLLP